jgi:hypothetical protein
VHYSLIPEMKNCERMACTAGWRSHCNCFLDLTREYNAVPETQDYPPNLLRQDSQRNLSIFVR